MMLTNVITVGKCWGVFMGERMMGHPLGVLFYALVIILRWSIFLSGAPVMLIMVVAYMASDKEDGAPRRDLIWAIGLSWLFVWLPMVWL